MVATIQSSIMDQSPAATRVLKALDDRVDRTLHDLLDSDVWRVLEAQPANSRFVVSIIREIMLEEYLCRNGISKAGQQMFERLPLECGKTVSALRALRSDDAENGAAALRDYFRLGGSQEKLDKPDCPAAFAVASVWKSMAAVENPLGYLGAEYLFSSFCSRVSPEISRLASSKGVAVDEMEILNGQTRSNIEYERLLRSAICRTVDQLPGCEEVILRCFEYCQFVYQLRLWNEALDRAIPKD
jgi:hypothetical protein